MDIQGHVGHLRSEGPASINHSFKSGQPLRSPSVLQFLILSILVSTTLAQTTPLPTSSRLRDGLNSRYTKRKHRLYHNALQKLVHKIEPRDGESNLGHMVSVNPNIPDSLKRAIEKLEQNGKQQKVKRQKVKQLNTASDQSHHRFMTGSKREAHALPTTQDDVKLIEDKSPRPGTIEPRKEAQDGSERPESIGGLKTSEEDTSQKVSTKTVERERKYRQYILNVALGSQRTRVTLWSVIVSFSSLRGPEIDWKSITKDENAKFAELPSVAKMLPKMKLYDMKSVCSHLLLHGFDIPKMLENISLTDLDGKQYKAEVLAESYTSILPEVAVMLRSTSGLRDISLRDWTRPLTGQEEGVYTFLSTNFLRNTWTALSIAEEARQRLARCATHSPQTQVCCPTDKNSHASGFCGDEILGHSNASKPTSNESMPSSKSIGRPIQYHGQDKAKGDVGSPSRDRAPTRNTKKVEKIVQGKKANSTMKRKRRSVPASELQPVISANVDALRKDERIGKGERITSTVENIEAIDKPAEKCEIEKSQIEVSGPPQCTRIELAVPDIQMDQFVEVNGIIDVGVASMQIVFPVDQVPPDSPLTGFELTGKYLPSSIFPPLTIFATSYMNLGSERALGLLMKQHCESTGAKTGGVCEFPCFPKGWRSACVPGHPSLQQDDKSKVSIDGNFLEPTGTYCDMSNFVAFQSAAIEFDCEEAGFPLSKPYEERIKIHNCDEVHGTGDFETCSALITKLLLQKQLPANQEASSFGAATPSEVGKFLQPSHLMYMVGRPVIEPVLTFKSLGLMPASSGQPSADFHYLGNATARYCSTPLYESVSGTDVPHVVSLQTHNYCFQASYIFSILKSLGVSTKGPPIYFKPDLRNSSGEKIGDIGWEIGSLLHTMLKPAFITDMYYLRANHWRPVLLDEMCSKE